MGSSSDSVSWPSGCPEKYSWIGGQNSCPSSPDIILQDLNDGLIDEPPICAHVKPIQDIARRQRDRIREVEDELGRQAHNMNNVEAVNEGLAERVSGLASYNCIVVNDLAAAHATAAANAASSMKYKIGFCVVTCILIICVMHMIF